MQDQEFITTIATRLHIETLPQEEQQEYLNKVLTLILKQAVIITHDTLEEDKRASFVKIIEDEEGDPKILLEAFSQEHDGKNIIEQATEKVLSELN